MRTLVSIVSPATRSDDRSIKALDQLAESMAQCRICRDNPQKQILPHEPRPIFRVSTKSRVLIASQAPGNKAHQSGVPFNDPSGERLRSWMGIGPDVFYDRDQISIVPMGFCFPGYDAHGGDRPPRPECRVSWHHQVFAAMPQITLLLAIGSHAIRFHLERLGYRAELRLGMPELVRKQPFFRTTDTPRLICLPHPSWRNTGWLNRNPWFAAEVLPVVQDAVRTLTAQRA